jgi:SP family general alpha glucoside:H+ symporter-like MFS transporter
MATNTDQEVQAIEHFNKPTPHEEPALPENDGRLEKPSSMDRLIADAKAATEKEHNMTLLQGIRLYPKAVFWSIVISSCIVMEGYDISLVGNLYGFPAFNQKYGELGSDGTYQIPARVCFLPLYWSE